MATINTPIRMDSDLRDEAQSLFSEFGLDLTTAINLFLRQSIREQRIPFDIKIDVPNIETIRAMEEVEEMKRNPTAYKSYTDVDEMMEDLLK